MKKGIVSLVVIMSMALLASTALSVVFSLKLQKLQTICADQELRALTWKEKAFDLRIKLTNAEGLIDSLEKEVISLSGKFDSTQAQLKRAESNNDCFLEQIKKLKIDFSDFEKKLEIDQKIIGELKDKELDWFQSEEELIFWLESWSQPNSEIGVLVLDPSVPLPEELKKELRDCDDYSLNLVKLAETDGYRIMEVPVEDGKVWNIRVGDFWERHVGCWTRINNIYYYIESSPTGEVVVIRLLPAD